MRCTEIFGHPEVGRVTYGDKTAPFGTGIEPESGPFTTPEIYKGQKEYRLVFPAVRDFLHDRIHVQIEKTERFFTLDPFERPPVQRQEQQKRPLLEALEVLKRQMATDEQRTQLRSMKAMRAHRRRLDAKIAEFGGSRFTNGVSQFKTDLNAELEQILHVEKQTSHVAALTYLSWLGVLAWKAASDCMALLKGCSTNIALNF